MKHGEILNIEYHKERLVMKALTMFGKQCLAAAALKIHSRTLRRYMDRYGIYKEDDVYKKKQKAVLRIYAP